MFRTLRDRLILSHVLPLLVIIPVMGLVLIYVLETQYLIPRLARNLLGDARLFSEITRAEYTFWGSPVFFERLLSRVEMDPSIRVMFLSPRGDLLFSSDPADEQRLDQVLSLPALAQVRQGNEVITMQYSSVLMFTDIIDVFTPVLGPNGQAIGIVRVSYRVASSSDLLPSVRNVIVVILLIGLGLGLILSLILAMNIGKPIRSVTQAIYDLAQGSRSQPLAEQGPRELRAQIRAINYLVERLASLEQSRRQLLANLVHELGRPLGALHSASQALTRGAGKDPQLLQDLAAGMNEQIAQMQEVLNDLAQLHDQIAGTIALKRELTPAREWLLRALLPWQEAAREKGLHWITEIPTELPDLMIDPGRMTQAVGNLASNAVKYTSKGGSVTVSAGSQNGEFWICFQDTGVGIAPEDQQKIFTPFFRSNQGRRIKEGMGLGLTIAHDLVAAHGGRIELESAVGDGSRFTIWIPLNLQRP
ncbi:MAG: HAMP domain-containing histidine kinase [Anaerolineae bacterium]|nr:HAMP domain-containing histidine kinase [Anaerolineae bacterium]